MTTSSRITVTTAQQLDALPLYSDVRDFDGTTWRKFPLGWEFRTPCGYSGQPKSSEFLAQKAPLTVVA